MRVVAIAILLMLLAGCTSSPSKSGTDDVGGTTSSSTSSAPDLSSSSDSSSAPPPSNLATLTGRVHDPGNLSIIGARVDVLSTEGRTVTNQTGMFTIANLEPAKVKVRVESGGFIAQEIEVTLKKSETIFLDVELRGDPAFGSGFVQHIHDYWGKDTTRLLMDKIIYVDEAVSGRNSLGLAADDAGAPSAAYVARTNQASPWEFFLPDSTDGKPNTIWPGTKEVRFTATWGSQTENNMPGVGFKVIDAAPGSTLFKDVGVVKRGETKAYVLGGPNATDNGHAPFTIWRFQIFINNNIQSAPNWQPVLAMGGIQVKIEIVKGDIILDPAHHDWWEGKDTLIISDPARDYRPNTGVPPIESDKTDGGAVITPTAGKGLIPVIPPGTEKLRVKFTYRLEQPLPFTYTMVYRTADQNPRDVTAAQFKTPKLLESGTGFRVYEITLKPGESDPFYAVRSQWGFKWVEQSGVPNPPYYFGGFFLHIGLEITAFKDPAY